MTTNMWFQTWELTTVLLCHLLNPVETSPLFMLWANDFTKFLLCAELFCHDVKLPILVPIRTDQQIPADFVDHTLLFRA